MYHVLCYLSTELSKTFFLLKNHFTASDCHKITSAMFPNNNLCFYPVSKVYPSLHFIVLKVIYLYLKVTLKPQIHLRPLFSRNVRLRPVRCLLLLPLLSRKLVMK